MVPCTVKGTGDIAVIEVYCANLLIMSINRSGHENLAEAITTDELRFASTSGATNTSEPMIFCLVPVMRLFIRFRCKSTPKINSTQQRMYTRKLDPALEDV